jgi:hypothetical protein
LTRVAIFVAAVVAAVWLLSSASAAAVTAQATVTGTPTPTRTATPTRTRTATPTKTSTSGPVSAPSSVPGTPTATVTPAATSTVAVSSSVYVPLVSTNRLPAATAAPTPTPTATPTTVTGGGGGSGSEWVGVVSLFESSSQVLVERANGERWVLEYGVGCLSLWRYVGKSVIVDSPGLFAGVGSSLILPDDAGSCRIWDGSRASP